MRRRTVARAVGIVFISAALNLIAAWSCAMWAPAHTLNQLPNYEGDGYPEEWPGGPYGTLAWWTTDAGLGYTQYNRHGAHGAEGDFIHWDGWDTPYRQAGWPLRAFQSTVQASYDPKPPHQPLKRWQLPLSVIFARGLQTNDLPAFLHAKAGRRLPLVPMWKGFVANTLLYSAAVRAALFLWRRGGRSLATVGRRAQRAKALS